MILADKIINERKKIGWSQEELADNLGVSRQAVSKWESAQSIPDIQRIVDMAKLFSVSTDYLLKEEIEEETSVVPVVEAGNENTNIRRISMEEANRFMDLKKRNAPKIANAVSMCITCPVILVFLAGLAESHIIGWSDELVGGIGLLALFGMIAVAVFTFIITGSKDEEFKHLERELFETEYGVSGMVKEKKNEYKQFYTIIIAIAVVMCILSAVPLVVAGLADAKEYVLTSLVALLLIIIAVAVNMMIRVGTVMESYNALLQEGEFTREDKEVNKKMAAFNGAYWTIITAIYLGWSFWTMNWGFTWIIWPVAGVAYAAISSIYKAIVVK